MQYKADKKQDGHSKIYSPHTKGTGMAEDDCGCGGKKQTRREFFQKTAAVGVGLTAMGMLTTVAEPARADSAGLCSEFFDACMGGCNQRSNAFSRAACKAGCNAQYAACVAGQLLQGLRSVAQDALNWIAANPGAVVGTIVVIGGIAFIVCTGGSGALVLALA